jgi:hypothetical protein
MKNAVASIENHRRANREDASISVKVIVPGKPPMILRTGNASTEGVFLRCARPALPPVGTELIITMEEFLNSQEPMALRARVVHVNALGMGIEFLGPLN